MSNNIRFRVPVVWSMMGYVDVELPSTDNPTSNDAIEYAKSNINTFSLPDGEYLEDSFEVDEEGVVYCLDSDPPRKDKESESTVPPALVAAVRQFVSRTEAFHDEDGCLIFTEEDIVSIASTAYADICTNYTADDFAIVDAAYALRGIKRKILFYERRINNE